MKISYISGTDANQTNNINSGIGRTGIEWGESINYNFSPGEKIKIRALRVLIPLVTVRGAMLKLIEGNRGGLGDILYALSPFNKQGKINQLVKNQYDAFMAQARREANNLYPLKRVTQGYLDALSRQGKIPSPQDPILGDLAFGQLPYAKDDNYKKHVALLYKAKKEATKKFKYIVYPASNAPARRKYRSIEIQWMKIGGNVDQFNDAVKNGWKNPPRNKTFNYLLGKIAAKRYKTKDLGLAIRAFTGALFGGDTFSWRDKDIFNPWVKRFGSQKIGTPIGLDPVTTGTALAAKLTGTQVFWLAVLGVIVWGAVEVLTADSDMQVGSGTFDGGNGGGGGNGNGGEGGFDVQSLLIPGAIAAGAYILLSDDKK